jgi:hypothetical protein
MGNAVNYPIFVEIRERNFKSMVENTTLSQVCLDWKENRLT